MNLNLANAMWSHVYYLTVYGTGTWKASIVFFASTPSPRPKKINRIASWGSCPSAHASLEKNDVWFLVMLIYDFTFIMNKTALWFFLNQKKGWQRKPLIN